MIVERREINCRERAAFEAARPGLCGEQLAKPVVAALRLPPGVPVDSPRLADAAVDGTRDGIILAGDGAHALFERARKELLEAAIAVGIAFGGFSHVDAVKLEKGADDRLLEPPG